MPGLPMVDITFAISARGTNGEENFDKMKSIVKKIIDKYSQGKVRYGMMEFGDTPSIKLRLTDTFTSDDELKRLIDTISRSEDGASLDKVMSVSKTMFEESDRSGAKKILVVIMDRRSTSDLDKTKLGVKSLENSGVIIIPVALGQEADLGELSNVTSDLSNVIAANGTVDAKTVADTVIKKAITGKSFNRLVLNKITHST